MTNHLAGHEAARGSLSGLEPYLAGTAWSPGLKIPIAAGRPSDRLTVLAELARGKAVIDLGCADAGQVDMKISGGTWLHRWVADAAERCIGVDTDEAAVARLQELGEREIYLADITGPVPVIDEARWDLLVMGEVLEHIDNPVAFLEAIRERHSGRIARVAFSVPNAFALLNVIGALRGRESINSDHRYWFTPYTMGKVLVRAGMQPEWFTFCDSVPHPGAVGLARARRALVNIVYGRVPAFRSDLIMVARIP